MEILFNDVQWHVRYLITWLVGGLVAIWIIFPEILGLSHHPNWQTPIFQDGVACPHQADTVDVGAKSCTILCILGRWKPMENSGIQTVTSIAEVGIDFVPNFGGCVKHITKTAMLDMMNLQYSS